MNRDREAIPASVNDVTSPGHVTGGGATPNGVTSPAGSNQVLLGFEHLMKRTSDASFPGDALEIQRLTPPRDDTSHSRRPSDVGDGSYVTSADADMSLKARVMRVVVPCTPIFVEIFGLVTYLADVGSDIWLAVYYHQNHDLYWGALTITFVTLSCFVSVCQWPHLLVSFYENSSKFRVVLVFLLFIPLCIIFAPVLTVFMALKLLKHYIGVYRYGSRGWKQEKIEADVASKSRLRLYEVIMESTPQLCLQLYIYNKQGPAAEDDEFKLLLQWVSIGTSLLSISVAGPMYDRVTHSTKKQLPWGLTVVHVLSTMCTVAARILTLALTLVIGPLHALPLFLPHMLFLTIWHCFFKIRPRSPNDWLTSAEWWFSLLTGVYMHSDIKYEFFDKDLGYRINFWVHYIILTLVNATMITYWFEVHGADVATRTYILIGVRLLGLIGIPLAAWTMWRHLELSAEQKQRLRAEKRRKDEENKIAVVTGRNDYEC